ncbi:MULTISPECIES: DMT family transporter [unclassified Pseudomonas]|jgi:drug/metabolite transporter (DMT)-like permease|uniref:DMT family transporter n=1 Tax=unclassified Pseudomonas TaxID=196821 RepID=UPI000EA9B430|nr:MULTISPECIES: DMT family transporter [unclassified Pseudomonas]AYF86606.1 EamA family transporter [Pseudomonas sp. DY-1]MRK21796.1 DMT family transporter [Pseudomonas sp. JG-B]
MPAPRTLLLTALAMLAFAGNSLLCRLALKHTAIDAVSFTAIRIAAGALMLWLLLRLRRQPLAATGNWRAAAALFVYAAAFSYAYLQLDAGAGALLLFGAVQLCMVVFGLLRGERLNPQQALGFTLATGGLVVLLLPGASAPPLLGGLLMLLAGFAWGAYTLLGRQAGLPLAATAGNFIRALPFAGLLLLPFIDQLKLDLPGFSYALLSGALTSGIGYAIWYSALPGLGALQAASVQLSVPVLAALGGAVLLGEHISLRLALVSVAVLGGIALVLRAKFQPVPQRA